jgi:hypothetical protein
VADHQPLTYPAFTVYFERSKVIDVVMTQSDQRDRPEAPTHNANPSQEPHIHV